MKLTIIRAVSPDGGHVSLRLAGSVDLVSKDLLIDVGREMVATEPVLALDLAEVDFIDSVGIGALIELAHAAEAQRKQLVLSALSPRVQRVLDAVGLGEAWT